LVKEYEQQYNDGLITQGEKYNKVVDAWAKCTDRIADIMCCLPQVETHGQTYSGLTYSNLFRVIVMKFYDAHDFDVRGVKKTCVHIVHKDGRHALLVDGKPFFMLGAQVNNSSAWPAQMPLVWPAIDRLGANTLEVPIAWEQIETQPGTFDFSYLDLLLAQARAHNVRLVLLWFGAWKNNGPSYTPAWVKLDNARYPRVVDAKGELRDSLSPIFPATLEAIKRATVTTWANILNLPIFDAEITNPSTAAIERRPVTANSRPMMITTAHAGAS